MTVPIGVLQTQDLFSPQLDDKKVESSFHFMFLEGFRCNFKGPSIYTVMYYSQLDPLNLYLSKKKEDIVVFLDKC